MYGQNQIAPLIILIRTIQHVAKLSKITTTSRNSSTDEKLVDEAQETFDLMPEHCDFWGYEK